LIYTMGNLIWHDWARFLTITACVYSIWAGYWGLFYRKFFWDFIGGVLRNPGGLQPPKSAAPFIAVIVKVPLVQISVILSSTFLLALDWPAPFMKKLPIYRSWVFRIVVLLFQSFMAILFYQGTNGAIWSLIAALAYMRAQVRGELMPEEKGHRGKA